MEKINFENEPENTASYFMRSDYLNEYLTFLSLEQDVEEKYKKLEVPKGFSDRYPNMHFRRTPISISEEERTQIEKLDKLAERARILVNDHKTNRTELLNIALEAAEICQHQKFIEKFKEMLEN
jgi:hypothetical protein